MYELNIDMEETMNDQEHELFEIAIKKLSSDDRVKVVAMMISMSRLTPGVDDDLAEKYARAIADILDKTIC